MTDDKDGKEGRAPAETTDGGAAPEAVSAVESPAIDESGERESNRRGAKIRALVRKIRGYVN